MTHAAWSRRRFLHTATVLGGAAFSSRPLRARAASPNDWLKDAKGFQLIMWDAANRRAVGLPEADAIIVPKPATEKYFRHS